MRARGRLAEPERNRRWLAMRILDSYLALLDSQHTPRRVSELKDVALQTLDRKVFVDCADDEIARLEHDCIISRVRNRTAGRNRRQPRAPATTQPLVHCIVMQIRGPSPALRAEPFRKHPHDRVKLFALEIAIRIRTTNHPEKIVFAPLLGSDGSDNLLRQNIELLFRNLQPIELATSHRIDDRRYFDKLVARERKDSAFRKTRDRM